MNDARGLVKVRRISDARQPDMALYGVEFIRLDPALRELIDRTLARIHRNATNWGDPR